MWGKKNVAKVHLQYENYFLLHENEDQLCIQKTLMLHRHHTYALHSSKKKNEFEIQKPKIQKITKKQEKLLLISLHIIETLS